MVGLLQEHAYKGFCEYKGQIINFNEGDYHRIIQELIFEGDPDEGKRYFQNMLFEGKTTEEVWREYHIKVSLRII